MAFVRVRDVSYRFGKRLALEGVNFSLAKGGFAFITGPSGAGKTTLLRILHGDLPLMHGHAVVAGFSLNAMARSELPLLRREACLIFQDYRILPERTVFENVALPLEVRGLPRARVAARVAEMAGALDLAKVAHERCDNLSGGERQRVAVARALAVGPQLILADEPTGNLDPDAALRLMDVFRQANTHGTAFIVATHDERLPGMIPGARLLHLEAGRLTATAEGGDGEDD
ncbi:MAG: ATP-binding cassette domain-containing protein [Desulfovibrionaceae bacterium]|nr:ATP-binding cassette domain-containing protein [Desulfovibrionaceae bacterium]MBF0513295.1 ATP-binding cassette domain-containing protein [Desulfovibrionaceae bacterium]